MTRAEAEAEALRLNREPDATGLWAAQRVSGDEWRVAHLVGEGFGPTRPTGTHTESRPKPAEPPDPRPAIFQNIPPIGPG